MFPTDIESIYKRIDEIDPIVYGRNRNFIDGAVSYLSPYVSRGVISTKTIMNRVLSRGYDPQKIERFLMELAWRDYWQQIWMVMGDEINRDLKRQQPRVRTTGLPKAIESSTTGIEGIDAGLRGLIETGYMHNHVRMYTASIVTSIGGYHWREPAQWMYYHLLDGDWASNALSWQWVCGANSGKQYIANQENVNTYTRTNQRDTWLDVSYETLGNMDCPNVLTDGHSLNLQTRLPISVPVSLDGALPTVVYTSYNLDPCWLQEMNANRVLLLEPSVLNAYPVSEKVIQFILELARSVIPGVHLVVCEFEELVHKLGGPDVQIHYKEHPLSRHYKGIRHERDWMSTVNGVFPSFFAFWNRCKKEILHSHRN
jgi:deoxyribodipyrimidine photo-lyase